MNSSIVRYFTKGTSVTRSPVITKTGWLKCQWCGVNPLLDDSPLLGCRGRIWETYIILTQMDCKSICDGGAGTISGSRYIEPDELFFWTACPVQECRGRSPLPQWYDAVRHILLGIIWRKMAADPAAPLPVSYHISEPTKRAILHPPLTICNQDVIVQIDTSQKNSS